MAYRLLVVPRWAGTPASDWYPWLKRELAAAHAQSFEPVVLAAMPNPMEPTIPAWVGRVKELLGSDPAEVARTVVVGHSVGCQAVIRALAEMPQGMRVAGVLAVAGWFWTDAPWGSLLPWIETPFDTARVKEAAGRMVVVISDNDRHTSDWQANRLAWQDRFGATVVVVPGANHFNGGQYPIVLQTLLDHFGQEGGN